MSGFLKDDLTVALDEVDRTATRIVTIYEDLAALAADPDLAARLREQGQRRQQTLEAFNVARRGAGGIPEVGDPERAHLQSLWLALKAAVAGEQSAERLSEWLGELDVELRTVIGNARALDPVAAIATALDALAADTMATQPRR